MAMPFFSSWLYRITYHCSVRVLDLRKREHLLQGRPHPSARTCQHAIFRARGVVREEASVDKSHRLRGLPIVN